MIGLWLYFALTIPDYATAAEHRFAAAAVCRVRLRRARRWASALISGGIDLSVGAIFAFCNFAALYFLFVLGGRSGCGDSGDAGGRRRRSAHQRLPDRLSEDAAVPDHAGDADHPARRRSIILNTSYATGVRHQLDRQRRLGLSSARQRARHSDQRRGADRRAAGLPHLPVALALWLAPDRDRRQPQGGAPRRHPRRTHPVRHLCAVGHAVRARAASSTRRGRQHRFDHRRRLGIPGADRRRARRRLARRRQGHGVARDDRRDHHLPADQRSGPDGHPRLRHLGRLSASSCWSPSASTSNGRRTAAR